MVKKKGAASKKKGSVPVVPAKEVNDEPAADTVLQVLNRRIRAAKKKIQKISVIEEARAGGKEINDDQAKTLASKLQVNAILEELSRVEPLISKALKKEIDGAVEKAVAEAKAENEPSEADEEEESTTVESTSEPKAEIDEAGQILDLLYVSQVFGFGGTEADYEAFLSAEESSEDKPITRQDLEKLAGFGKSLFTRSVEDGFTHEEALNRCKNMALTFIRTPDAFETSVAEMSSIITRLKASDFFKQEIITPTQAEPEPVVEAPPIEESEPDPVPEMDPTVQAPAPTPETAAVGHVPDPHVSPSAAPELYSSIMAPSQAPQHKATAAAAGGGGGAPQSFLPFSSLSMPLSAPPHVSPPPTFSNQMAVPNSMGFGVSNSAAPGGGYMQQQGGGYGTPTPQDPPAEANISGMAPQAPEVDHQTAVESDMTPPAPQDPVVRHPPQAQHNQPMELKPPAPRGVPQEPPKHAPAQASEQGGLEARPRGPGGPPRRPRGYDGQYQRHGGQAGPMGGQGGPYGGGGRGVWGGGYNNYGGGGYRGGSWEGRGRGRGRSGGNYGGDGGYGGRGHGPSGYPRGGRGGRGGFRGRGGGPAWSRPQPQPVPSHDHN